MKIEILGEKTIKYNKYCLIRVNNQIYFTRYSIHNTLSVGRFSDYKICQLRNAIGNIKYDITKMIKGNYFDFANFWLSEDYRDEMNTFLNDTNRIIKLNEFLR